MRGFLNRLMILAAAFAGIFLLNMFIMHLFFNIDVFNPVNRNDPGDNLAQIRLEPENGSENSPDEDDSGHWTSDDEAEDGTILHTAEETGLLPENIDIAAESSMPDRETTYYMTTGEVGYLENLSLMEKLEAFTLISKVGREEADRIYDMAVDGITYAEMDLIKEVLNDYLSEDEMNTLMALLEKSKLQYYLANE